METNGIPILGHKADQLGFTIEYSHQTLIDISWEAEANLELLQAGIKFKEIIDDIRLKKTLQEHLTNIINNSKKIIESL